MSIVTDSETVVLSEAEFSAQREAMDAFVGALLAKDRKSGLGGAFSSLRLVAREADQLQRGQKLDQLADRYCLPHLPDGVKNAPMHTVLDAKVQPSLRQSVIDGLRGVFFTLADPHNTERVWVAGGLGEGFGPATPLYFYTSPAFAGDGKGLLYKARPLYAVLQA